MYRTISAGEKPDSFNFNVVTVIFLIELFVIFRLDVFIPANPTIVLTNVPTEFFSKRSLVEQGS